jgi:murein DD-endopeptidase MepM/ murein hydrolase activator NlpD
MRRFRKLFTRGPTGIDGDTLDIIVSSASGAESVHLRVRKSVVLTILASGALAVILLVVLVFSSGSLIRQVARARVVSAENAELRRQLLRLNEMQGRLAKIESTRRALLQIAGVEDRGTVYDESPTAPADTPQTSSYGWAEPDSAPGAESLAQIAGVLRRPPLEGHVSRRFGQVDKRGMVHTGIDIVAATGTPVQAPGNGVVSFVGNDETLGQVVVLSHGPELESMYGHNSSILVRPGDFVVEGQAIAQVGSTGLSSGPHLHYEIRWFGRAIDPAAIMGSAQGGSR